MKKTMKFWDLVALEVGMDNRGRNIIYIADRFSECGGGNNTCIRRCLCSHGIIMINVMLLGSTLPTTGGTFKYGAFLFSPKVAFLGLWAYLFGAFVGLFPLNALALASYMKGIWDGIALVPVALIILTSSM
jgi:APA family basic amino acid/polyamine antiporter